VKLRENAAAFAAFKNHAEQADLFKLLTDESGKPRGWNEFRKLAAPITGQYNRNWLKAEYNQAVATSQMAKKWESFRENADLYPNLMYRTAGDKNVRASHAILDGVIRPIKDPFWKTNFPPNGWNCRCNVVQTGRKATAGNLVPEFKPDPGFDFNPGMEGKLFSEKAGYFKSGKASGKEIVKQVPKLVSGVTRNDLRGFYQVNPLPVLNLEKFGKIKLTQSDIRKITGKETAIDMLKNSLLYDIENVVKNAVYILSAPEGKGRPQYKMWHYYKVSGFDSLYLNFAEYKSGEIKLHSIEVKLKEN